MIGSLIGAGIGAVGSIFGGISASNAMRKYKRALANERKRNEAWYNRRYNEDATQRADAQRVLTMTQEAIRDRNREATGRQAVVGGTEAAVASTKSANAQAMAEAASRIAVAGEARKDDVERQYLGRDAELASQQGQLQVQRANNTAQAISGVLGAAGNIAGALDEGLAAKKTNGIIQ